MCVVNVILFLSLGVFGVLQEGELAKLWRSKITSHFSRFFFFSPVFFAEFPSLTFAEFSAPLPAMLVPQIQFQNEYLSIKGKILPG
jgi:hypothetical protein